MTEQHINAAGLDLIKRFEGLRLKAYKDVRGIWTLGYGHIDGVVEGMECTPEKADEWLKSDVETAERAVGKIIDVALTDNQFSALVSFVFNLGAGALKNGTVPDKIRRSAWQSAAETIKKYNKARINGVLIEVIGLANRRDAEAALFLSP